MEDLYEHERLAANLLGNVGDRREIDESAHGGELVWRVVLSELAPSVQDFMAALDGVPEDACVHVRVRE